MSNIDADDDKEKVCKSTGLISALVELLGLETGEAFSHANTDKWKERPPFATRDVLVIKSIKFSGLRSVGFAMQSFLVSARSWCRTCSDRMNNCSV